MLDSERFVFKSILDTLADMLRVTRLEASAANEYFESLKKYNHEKFIAAVKRLQENYEPKRSNDFPVLKVFHQAIASIQTKDKDPTWECRCCKKPYPAGSKTLNCDCLLWDHCFKCDKCHKHCPCRLEERISVDEISAWAVAEYDRIMQEFYATHPERRPRLNVAKQILKDLQKTSHTKETTQ